MHTLSGITPLAKVLSISNKSWHKDKNVLVSPVQENIQPQSRSL